MPYADSDDFISRPAAVKKYGRSKSSFIRDVEDAFEANDVPFLDHFKVFLNDGTVLDGQQATKAALQKVQEKQPRWMIEVSHLESRYWEEGTDGSDEELPPNTTPASSPKRKSKPRQPTSTVPDDAASLQYQLELTNEKLIHREETITGLREDKKFLQTELENRRDDIKELQGFFSSVGDAADSTAKLKQGEASQPRPPDTAPASAPFVDISPSKPLTSTVLAAFSGLRDASRTTRILSAAFAALALVRLSLPYWFMPLIRLLT